MAFTSLSEDIEDRHRSDVFDIERALEQGQISQRRQRHALPEFQKLIEMLTELLRDPAHPLALKVRGMRQQISDLEAQLEQIRAKNERLGQTNGQLNAKNIRTKKEIENLQARARELRASQAQVEDSLKKRIAELEGRVTFLEAIGPETRR